MTLLSSGDPRFDLDLADLNYNTGNLMDDTPALLEMVNGRACDCDVRSCGCWSFFIVCTSLEDGDGACNGADQQARDLL